MAHGRAAACGRRIRLARCQLRFPARRSNSIAISARFSPISALPATVRMPPSGRPNCASTRKPAPGSNSRKGRFAIVPGDPERSELVRRVTSSDTAVRMPPAYAGRAPLKRRRNRTDSPLDRPRRPLAAVLVVHPAAAARAARGSRREVGAQSDRPLHSRPPGTGGTASGRRGRQGDAAAPRESGPDRPSAHARAGGRVSSGCFAGRLRQGGGPTAGVAALRRAHGVSLDGSGALRRHQRLPDRRAARHVALARLGDRRLQPQSALRPLHHRATGRRSAARCHARAAHRHRLQPQSPHQRRRRHHSRGVSRGVRGGPRADHCHRLDGAHRGMRALPRSQVRPASRRRNSTGSSPISTGFRTRRASSGITGTKIRWSRRRFPNRRKSWPSWTGRSRRHRRVSMRCSRNCGRAAGLGTLARRCAARLDPGRAGFPLRPGGDEGGRVRRGRERLRVASGRRLRSTSTASITWKPTARSRTSTICSRSPWRRGSSPRAPNGAIVSHVEDYFEGMGHGLLPGGWQDPRAHPSGA